MARYALVIGIAKYGDNFRNLPKAVNDAEQIAQLLRKQGRFDVEPLPGKLVESENCWQVAPDKKLTGKELGQRLRTFLLEKAEGDEVLIYFAGHGFEALSSASRPMGYLATSDCNQDGQNAFSFDDFNWLISESRLSSLVVLLDCCYAGSLLERSFIRSSFPVFNSKQDYCLITASRAFERAREDAEGGIFTKAILRGLSQDKADETTGEINVNDLMSFISRELKGSGQEAIYMGGGRSIPLVFYPPKNPLVARTVSEECPYRGLEAFDKNHAKFFFGRQKVVNSIQQKLELTNFISIIGASGSGKSSVVLAGLIPELEKNGWRILGPIMPGVEPLAELKRIFTQLFERTEIRKISSLIDTDGLCSVISLIPGSERFLLVVDQFEEVFNLCAKEEERHKFIKLLTQVIETFHKTSIQSLRLSIVTTIRVDFIEHCLSYELLTNLIQNQAVYIPPLLGAELEESIILPATLQGYRFEEGLLGEIIQDVGKEQGCLPLLQFALTELWEKRNHQTYQLTVAKYKELGGVVGALNRHAENLYDSFTEKQQEWVKRIFLKLVRTGAKDKDTRNRQIKAKLLKIAVDNPDDMQGINDVLEKLIQGRLLVINHELKEEIWVDLAHEALMEGWERFAKWRKQGRELRRLIERLEDALREWQEEPKNENLMMGGLLTQVQANWPTLEPNLDNAGKHFYILSNKYRQDQIAALEQAFTEREQAEQRIREQANLLDITTDAILVWDLQGYQILFWNKGAEYLYGWQADEALGKRYDELLYKETLPILEAALTTVTESGAWHGELRKVQKSGKEIIVESRWTLQRDATGLPKSIFTIDTDITEKKQLEMQFLHAQRLESLGTLAGGIAHDFNNILTPILAATQLLNPKHVQNENRYQQLLGIVESNAKRGAALVKQVLSFARGFQGERTIVQLKHLIAEITQIAKQTFPKSIDFSVSVPQNLSAVHGDATQLHQVLMNLVVNARDAMPEGGRISILAENMFIDEAYAKMHLDAQVGDYIVVKIADTGIGMPPEVQDRIFEPFFTTKEVGAGTGLGLSTVLGIIRSHGGFVNVSSQVGKGSEFKIFLPAVEAGQRSIETDSELPLGNGELILVVDHEVQIREIATIILENNNYKTLTASNGIEAIATYAQHKHQIRAVLMDMMMPEMDGLTAIRTIQKMNPLVKVIASSGLVSSGSINAAHNMGVKTFLPKPYTANQLLQAVSTVNSGN